MVHPQGIHPSSAPRLLVGPHDSQPQHLSPTPALRVQIRHLPKTHRTVTLAVRRTIIQRRGVERRAVVPDRDVVLAPAVAHLQVVVLGDVPEEVLEDVVGLLGVQLEDALREGAVHVEGFVACDGVRADHGAGGVGGGVVSCGKGGRGGEGDVLNGGEVLALVEGRAARVLDFEALGLCVLCGQFRD